MDNNALGNSPADEIEAIPYIQRDISWLSFNYRVLQEAKDNSVPLLERLKFLAIYSSNMGEFFRVRVANHRNIMRAGKKPIKDLKYDPQAVLDEIKEILSNQLIEFSDIFENQIVPALDNEGIRLIRPEKLSNSQVRFIQDFFQSNMLPFVQPVLLLKDKIRPFLNNASLYLTLELQDLSRVEDNLRYAIVKIPSDHLPRFIEIPDKPKRNTVIMLDDIVRITVPILFPGYKIVSSYSIKLTRDAELYIDDEYSGDLVEKIKKGLGKRHVGLASRLVYDREMPKKMLDFLMEQFTLDPIDCVSEGRYHNNFDFFGFPNFGYQHLLNAPLAVLLDPAYLNMDPFSLIKRKNKLLYFPYHSYEPVVHLFERAAIDPFVTHIKIMQYRIGNRSRILHALMNAVKAGKQVSAFIEIKARFDEEANLNWAEKLEKAGVNVHYSIPGIKVHSKLAIVRRIEGNTAVNYAYLSTGNFNEKTAELYTDFGYFTADRNITNEVLRIFTSVETSKPFSKPFKHLLVGNGNLRSALIEKIDREISNATIGKEAFIKLKMNNLQDREMIEKLYEASQAGVKITLIIRSVCSLVAGLKGVSENIRAISIVDRYLEHPRVYWFCNDGDDQIYLSSADWMQRNLSHRIEAAFPLTTHENKQIVKDIFAIQLKDNVKARLLDHDRENEYRVTETELAFQSQLETYYYFKRKLDDHVVNSAGKKTKISSIKQWIISKMRYLFLAKS